MKELNLNEVKKRFVLTKNPLENIVCIFKATSAIAPTLKKPTSNNKQILFWILSSFNEEMKKAKTTTKMDATEIFEYVKSKLSYKEKHHFIGAQSIFDKLKSKANSLQPHINKKPYGSSRKRKILINKI
jgi:hypothetical protein